MFTNCPYCRYLVALGSDGLPLPRCPNCARRLREDTPAEARAAQAEREANEASATTAADAVEAATPTNASSDGTASAHAATPADTADAPLRPAAFEAPGGTDPVDDDAGAGFRNGVAASASPTWIDALPYAVFASPEVRAGAEERLESEAASAPARSIADPTPETHTRDAAVARNEAPDAIDAVADPSVSAPAMDTVLSDDGAGTAAPALPADDADDPAPAIPDTPDPIATDAMLRDPVQLVNDAAVAAPIAAPIAEAAMLSGDADTDGDADADAEPGWATPSESMSDTLASQPAPVDTTSEAMPNAAAQSRARPAAPSFVRVAAESRPTDKRRSRLQLGAIGALALLLALQLAIADRARLAGDARWRPAVAALCDALRCSLPPWREPQAFALLQRNVQPHASIPGTLRVTASFRNDARWPQPWPALQLTLSDVDGREAGTRIFSPREYLGAAPTQTMLESGQSAAVALDIREPSPQVVAFTFDFR